jgi:hypothetical protein
MCFSALFRRFKAFFYCFRAGFRIGDGLAGPVKQHLKETIRFWREPLPSDLVVIGQDYDEPTLTESGVLEKDCPTLKMARCFCGCEEALEFKVYYCARCLRTASEVQTGGAK